jgi:hypothetical protein
VACIRVNVIAIRCTATCRNILIITPNEQVSGSSPLVGSLHFFVFAGKSQRKVTDGNGLPIGLELANANDHEVKLAVPVLQTV